MNMKCELCGEPMPAGEEMFKYHDYSGDCPKPSFPRTEPSRIEIAYGLLWLTETTDRRVHDARRLLLKSIDKDGQERGIVAAKKVTEEKR